MPASRTDGEIEERGDVCAEGGCYCVGVRFFLFFLLFSRRRVAVTVVPLTGGGGGTWGFGAEGVDVDEGHLVRDMRGGGGGGA